jgi:hypothetical protein
MKDAGLDGDEVELFTCNRTRQLHLETQSDGAYLQ